MKKKVFKFQYSKAMGGTVLKEEKDLTVSERQVNFNELLDVWKTSTEEAKKVLIEAVKKGLTDEELSAIEIGKEIEEEKVEEVEEEKKSIFKKKSSKKK